MKKPLLFLLTILLVFSSAISAPAEGTDLSLMTLIDQKKRIVQYVWMDPDGYIVPGPDGYAVIECQYEKNQVYPFKVRYLDEKGQRVENQDSYAVIKLEYDRRYNRISEATFYGHEGKIQDTVYGYAHVFLHYAGDTVESALFYDARARRLDDPEGRLLESVSFWAEQDGTPIIAEQPVPLFFDWNPEQAPELPVQGYVRTTALVNMRRDPKYSNIMARIPADTVLPYFTVQSSPSGTHWYCVEDETAGRGYIDSEFLLRCNADGSEYVPPTPTTPNEDTPVLGVSRPPEETVEPPAVLGVRREEPGPDVPEVTGQVLGSSRLPQTGVLWWPVPVMLLIGCGMMAYGYRENRMVKAAA